MTCDASGTSVAGQYENTGTVTSIDPAGGTPTDSDLSHYFGLTTGIDIEKATNGDDADAATGPYIAVGDPVTWTYVVTNTGNTLVTNVSVVDDQGVTVDCLGQVTLAAFASMTCTATGTATVGQYSNLGTVTGDSTGNGPVTDSDPSHYFGVTAEVDIEKSTATSASGPWFDADAPTGPYIPIGDDVFWQYEVMNLGSTPLANVVVTDDQGVTPVYQSGDTNGNDLLEAGETWIYTASGVAVAGQYENVGTATATVAPFPPVDGDAATLAAVPADIGDEVTDSDLSHYFGSDPKIELFKNGSLNLGDNDKVDPGDIIVYTFTVENTGNVELTGPALTDLSVLGLDVTCPWDSDPSFVLGIGFANRVNCTADYEVTQADIDAGQVLNCAMIEATGPAGTDVEAEACTTVDEPQEAEIDIVKTTLTPEIFEGESVTYELTVTNTGNVTLSDVVVVDPLAPDCDRTFGGILVPGETVSYQCTLDDVTAAFTNVADVAGTPPTPISGEVPAKVTAIDDSPVVVILLATLGDTVWNDANSNGVQDNGEKGIAGAVVTLTMSDGTVRTTTTDVDGKYVFIDLIPGTYIVALDMSSIPQPAEGELKLTTASSFTVILAAGDNHLDSDFGVVAVLPVTGINTGSILRFALALLLAGVLAVFLATGKRKDEGDLTA
jgi:uncharacterized repeat protein (TIGR01451 family)